MKLPNWIQEKVNSNFQQIDRSIDDFVFSIISLLLEITERGDNSWTRVHSCSECENRYEINAIEFLRYKEVYLPLLPFPLRNISRCRISGRENATFPDGAIMYRRRSTSELFYSASLPGSRFTRRRRSSPSSMSGRWREYAWGEGMYRGGGFEVRLCFLPSWR